MSKINPIHVAHLLGPLDTKLIALLRRLSPEDWQRQTVARLWKVKDVVAHLLDGNIRLLSIARDDFFGEVPHDVSYEGMVGFLNGLNADWVRAMRRVSTQMLINLHQCTGPAFCEYFEKLDPFATAALPVAWAGEEQSLNWMEIAREYTEKWLHQQQIRDAINDDALMTREFFHPFISIFMLGMPHALRKVAVSGNASIRIEVASDIGDVWYLQHASDGWAFTGDVIEQPSAWLNIPPGIAWKLFSKSIRPEDIMDRIEIGGDPELARVALNMVSVMA